MRKKTKIPIREVNRSKKNICNVLGKRYLKNMGKERERPKIGEIRERLRGV
jgi:hypothetical protein